jgi:hypothetical protein
MCTKDSVPKTMCQEQEQCAQGNVQEQEQCAQDNVPGARAVCPRQCTRRKNRKSKEENRTQAVVDIINLMFEQICKHTHLHTHKHAHTCSHSLTQTYTQTHLGAILQLGLKCWPGLFQSSSGSACKGFYCSCKCTNCEQEGILGRTKLVQQCFLLLR